MSQATIEIGHRYGETPVLAGVDVDFIMDSQKPDLRHSIPNAKRLRQIADTLAPNAVRMALLDDTVLRQEAQKPGVERWRADLAITRLLSAVQSDTEADEIYLESSLELPARRLVGFIQGVAPYKGHKVSPEKGNKLFVRGDRSNTIKLMGKDMIDDPTYPSCDVLDLTWLMIRTQNYDHVTTVLPRGFEQQQGRVAILADLIGIHRDAYTSEFYD